MKLFLHKGTFHIIKVTKVNDSLSFLCKMWYSYDWLCWDKIEMDYECGKYSFQQVKAIQEEIINNLNKNFR